MTDFYRANSAHPRWKEWTAGSLQILLALVFAAAGGSKLAAVSAMVDMFAAIGAGQWFRVVTGSIEVTGAVLLLVPVTMLAGAGLLGCVMVGAVCTHLFVIGGNPLPAAVLLTMLGVAAWLRWQR